MKTKITVIGFVTMLLGLWPIITMFVPSIPMPIKPNMYYSLLMLIGVIDLLYSFLAHIDLLGMQHVVTAVIAFLTIIGGLIPFIKNSGAIPIPAFIPVAGLGYYMYIVLIGLAGFVYGLYQLKY